MASPQKENGYTPIANEILEILSGIRLSGYETRVIMVIWRKTYGWKKKEDWISFSQFRELTELQDSHISRSLKKLVDKNIVTKNGKLYSFQKNYQIWQVELPKWVSEVTKNGKKKLPKMADTKERKETIQKKLYKRKENTDLKKSFKRGELESAGDIIGAKYGN